MGNPNLLQNQDLPPTVNSVGLAVADVSAASSGIVLGGVPTNEQELIASGHKKVILNIEINGGKLIAWIKKNGSLYEIRSQGTELNLVSYGLTEDQAIENMEEILRRNLSSSRLRLSE